MKALDAVVNACEWGFRISPKFSYTSQFLSMFLFIQLVCGIGYVLAEESEFGPLRDRLSSAEVWQSVFPDADRVSDPTGDPPASLVFLGEEILGYLYSTYESVGGRGYAGGLFDIVAGVTIDNRIAGVRVLGHNEPIIRGFRPKEDGFRKYLSGLRGMSILQSIRRSAVFQNSGSSLDGISGATISANLAHGAVISGARVIARSRGLLNEDIVEKIVLDMFAFETRDWPSLLSDGSVRCENFLEKGMHRFPESICVALITPAGIGRNLFGAKWHGVYVSQIGYGDHLLWIGSKGTISWRESLGKPQEVFIGESKFLSSGEGEGLTLRQGNLIIPLLPKNLWNPQRAGQFSQGGTALRTEKGEEFDSVGIVKISSDMKFKPYLPWVLQFDFGNQGEDEKSRTFSTDISYQIPVRFVVGSDFDLEEEGLKPISLVLGGLVRESKLSDWQRTWVDQAISISVLLILLVVVTNIFLFEHPIAKKRQLHKWVRIAILSFVLLWLGWIAGAQLSIVNIFSYGQALFGKLEWTTLLFEPLIVILMGYTALSLVFLGRGVFCGWLCPFGALQELLNRLARFFRVPQFSPKFRLSKVLRVVKYPVVIALVGVSVFWSMEWGLQGAEIEPFKTAITLKFERAWPFGLYAILLLFVGLFVERFFCRCLCPLGATLAIFGRFHIFQFLKRRPQCGSPCHACEASCPVQAIEPSGKINMAECFQCLDCQVDYYDDTRCPPLIAERKRNERLMPYVP
ncbi:MAG: hypothetical protein CMM32_09440 [Rhodospirillaceae bacterium]|nr:hypothetical protein [Rhodospirillaceae bacterium]